MTTIRPLTGGINLEVWHIDDGGYALINIGPLPKPSKGGYVSEQSARYPVADLLAALDAVPRALIEEYRDSEYRKYAQEADRAEELENRLETVTAERDAHAATIERVREIAENSYNSSWLALKGIRAALDPKPAFTLPTEAGAGIMARDCSGDESELRLFACGSWVDQLNGCDWSPERVLTEWTDHRLLDGAE